MLMWQFANVLRCLKTFGKVSGDFREEHFIGIKFINDRRH